jgi:penicillin-binding protein 1A
LLAGLVQAPSRLAPTGNLKGARERQKLVIGAMVSAGLIDQGARGHDPPRGAERQQDEATCPTAPISPTGCCPRRATGRAVSRTEQTVQTTLELPAQQSAERAVRSAGLRKSQIAIVAMHPDGRVIAMVGGKSYADSPFNRATQARRQPGSTFKLFVYLAALRGGMTRTASSTTARCTIGDWKPENSHGSYAGQITLRQAFAKSSNVVAARLTQKFGVRAVTQAARDLGISTPIGNDASIALGTSTVSLLELTSAYASVANGSYPVRPLGLSDDEAASDWLARRLGARRASTGASSTTCAACSARWWRTAPGAARRCRSRPMARPARRRTIATRCSSAMPATWIVCGVWLGNDDNSPNPGLSGSGLPARVWRDFMTRTLDLHIPPPEPTVEPDGNDVTLDDVINGVGDFIQGTGIETQVVPPGVDPDEQGEAPIDARPSNERRPRRGQAPDGPTDRFRQDDRRTEER